MENGCCRCVGGNGGTQQINKYLFHWKYVVYLLSDGKFYTVQRVGGCERLKIAKLVATITSRLLAAFLLLGRTFSSPRSPLDLIRATFLCLLLIRSHQLCNNAGG